MNHTFNESNHTFTEKKNENWEKRDQFLPTLKSEKAMYTHNQTHTNTVDNQSENEKRPVLVNLD